MRHHEIRYIRLSFTLLAMLVAAPGRAAPPAPAELRERMGLDERWTSAEAIAGLPAVLKCAAEGRDLRCLPGYPAYRRYGAFEVARALAEVTDDVLKLIFEKGMSELRPAPLAKDDCRRGFAARLAKLLREGRCLARRRGMIRELAVDATTLAAARSGLKRAQAAGVDAAQLAELKALVDAVKPGTWKRARWRLACLDEHGARWRAPIEEVIVGDTHLPVIDLEHHRCR